MVIYKTSDKKIATVSEHGTITAKSSGLVSITTTITLLYSGKKVSFTTTVKVSKNQG